MAMTRSRDCIVPVVYRRGVRNHKNGRRAGVAYGDDKLSRRFKLKPL